MLRLRSVCVAILAISCGFSADADDWLRFRGPNGSGISDTSVPVEFGADQNLKWQVDLPGRGVSSPIVVGDRIFVTCYSGYGMNFEEPGEIEELQRHLVCVARPTGEILWTQTESAVMPEDPYSGAGVPAHGYASHTPTSDGQRVFVFYGKSGVFAYDLEGNKLWHTMVGQESGPMQWGSSSSPILNEGLVIVMASDESETLYGLDVETGEERWKSSASGFSGVWGTPALADGRKGTEVIVAVPGETWAINAQSGKFSWYAPGNEGGSHSIVIGDGVAYSVGGSRGGSAAVAVELGGKGEIEDVVWEANASSRFATPLLYDGHLFCVANNIVTCVSADSGEEIFKEKLPERFGSEGSSDEPQRRGRRGRFGGQSYGSPVIAGGKIYITDVKGTIYVIEASPEFTVLAKNDMSFDTSGFNGTPAVSDGEMFIRSHKALYCVAE